MSKVDEIKESISVMEKYLLHKVNHRDWHAVWDAAMDIDRLESNLLILQEKETPNV